jgi:hypothetical protein
VLLPLAARGASLQIAPPAASGKKQPDQQNKSTTAMPPQNS